jgi:glycosyltransferase involved in cell wall biosynthesis
MRQLQKITILIPCHNEERGIARVIDGVPLRLLKRLGYRTEVIVINNNSTDRTVEIVHKKNATVIHEEKKGKGHAIKTGFSAVSDDTTFVVMLDGDNTYKTKEILRLIEPLMSNFCDVVIGSRLSGKMKKNSLKFQNRVANWAYTFLVRQFYRTNITDVLSGYFAWKKEAIDKLAPHLESEGFEIEMEMITKMEKLGFEVYSVPITYDERAGQTKIEAIKDGIKILTMFVKNLNWSPNPRPAKSFQIEPIQTN